MALFLERDVGMKPFIINGEFKVYGYPYTVYASSPLFWGIPLHAFVESRYVSIAIGSSLKGFPWLWSHLNGITPNNNMMKDLGLSFDERIGLWDMVKLFGMEKSYNVIYSFIDSITIGVTELERILDIPELLTVDSLVRDYRSLPLVYPGVREVSPFDALYAHRYFLDGKRDHPFPTIPISEGHPDTPYDHHILMWYDDKGLERFYTTTSKVDEDEDTGNRPILPLIKRRVNVADLVKMAREAMPDRFLDVTNLSFNGTGVSLRDRGDISTMRSGSTSFNIYSRHNLHSVFQAIMLSGVEITPSITDEVVRSTNTRRSAMTGPVGAAELRVALRSAEVEMRKARSRHSIYAIPGTDLYTATADIGDIKAGMDVEVFSGYEIDDGKTGPELINDPLVPSLPREIYNYLLPSLFKFAIGPYLLEGSPGIIRSRSPYFEEITQLSPDWMKVHILEGSPSLDRDSIIFVWSYLNGITDDFSQPHYPLSYLSLLRCWDYISYFQIPLTSMFVSNYVRLCFDRAPKHKDPLIYQLLMDIGVKSSQGILYPDPERRRKLDILGGVEKSE